MDIPAKLDPIPDLDRSLLPAWIADFGTIDGDDEFPDGFIVMTAKLPNGDLLHVDASRKNATFDETFWQRYAEPMVNNIGSALFEAEHPGKTMPSFLWDAASRYGEPLTEVQKAIITRRKELTWTCPTRVLPD